MHKAEYNIPPSSELLSDIEFLSEEALFTRYQFISPLNVTSFIR